MIFLRMRVPRQEKQTCIPDIMEISFGGTQHVYEFI